jgi:hypothetical protein
MDGAGGSKALLVISAAETCLWYAFTFTAEMTGSYEESMKWIRVYVSNQAGLELDQVNVDQHY